ncbi:replication initiator [Pilimelia anulata]|uniref:replication initiator n=1 Tax=Pilimelia anulata TaxID=53371 RepID=UPI001E6212F2|nr:replication initiator [Pilimelia anulata]
MSNAETAPLPPRWSDHGAAFHRTTQPNYDTWLNHVRAAAGCTRPVQLAGTLAPDPVTGQPRHTEQLPDGVIYKACGNRRHTVCPSCARTYQNDAYQLIRAGLVGGKGVPDSVARHPASFATFTAPSFGPVHTHKIRRHTCRNRKRCDCRPDPCRARRPEDISLCAHGRPMVCFARHHQGDTVVGTPICADCYDYDHQVVWNLYSGELWRRTKQTADRHLRKLCRRRGIPFVRVPADGGKFRYLCPVRLAHGKVAEFQRRGVVHFHALLRLDGVNPLDLDAVVPPPAGISIEDLHDALRHATASNRIHVDAHPDRPDGWPIEWGTQLDLRPLNLAGDADITDGMAAGYLAKYATKSTEITGHTSTRITADTIDSYADPEGTHVERIVDACWRLARPLTAVACKDGVDSKTASTTIPNPCQGLRRWAHMLGFGGHFFTKARRYSTTFTVLRAARIDFRRAKDHQDQADDGAVIRTADHLTEETTLVVGALTYAGAGWRNTGDALLANTAAAMARARAEVARDEIAHELGYALVPA